MSIDLDAHYQVEGMPGVAWWLKGYAQTPSFPEVDWEEVEWTDDPTQVVAVMVGDDRAHTIDVDDLIVISEDDYCGCCGQIGCSWG